MPPLPLNRSSLVRVTIASGCKKLASTKNFCTADTVSSSVVPRVGVSWITSFQLRRSHAGLEIGSAVWYWCPLQPISANCDCSRVVPLSATRLLHGVHMKG